MTPEDNPSLESMKNSRDAERRDWKEPSKEQLDKPGFSLGLSMSLGSSTSAKSGKNKSLWRDDFRAQIFSWWEKVRAAHVPCVGENSLIGIAKMDVLEDNKSTRSPVSNAAIASFVDVPSEDNNKEVHRHSAWCQTDTVLLSKARGCMLSFCWWSTDPAVPFTHCLAAGQQDSRTSNAKNALEFG